jgi:protein SERAC1
MISIGQCQVVQKDSAILNDAFEVRDTIHADHVSMCKFSDKQDSGYKKVLDAIEVLLEGRFE